MSSRGEQVEASSSAQETGDVSVWDIPAGVRIKQSVGRGRGLFAESSFKPGARILRTKPIVAVNSTKNLSTFCSACHLAPGDIAIARGQRNSAITLKRCQGCRIVHYCSQGCQTGDWTFHREECRAHKRLRVEYAKFRPNARLDEDLSWIMDERFRAVGRLCWARKREMQNGRDPDWWAQIDAMESHIDRMPQQQIMELGQQIQRFRQYLSAAERDTPGLADMEEYGFGRSSDLLKLFSAFQINSFTLSSPSLSPIGVAMSPIVALCNHSCEPNAVVVFPHGGRDMDIVAIRQIATGEEILTSYIDISLPLAERQADLKERYGFICDCELCQRSRETSWVDPRWCVYDSSGGLKSFEGECSDFNDCSQSSSSVDKHFDSMIQQGRAMLNEDEAGTLDVQQALVNFRSLIPTLSQKMPSSSYPLQALLRLQALLLSPPRSTADRDLAIASLSAAFAGAEKVYPAGHPTLAVISAEWCKLVAMDSPEDTPTDILKKLKQAVIGLRKTVKLNEVGFGAGGGIVGKEMTELLKACEVELSQLA
ncbi:hypothetical protein BD324DRAFT_677953 [Kockovaella imperatae]|uniref:SET domain-containing protein n=1 Tax=Kockovaella imperatae TaxID=4999 RepID=A0A1Y1UR86_9TREE|nr:hypothetical protein BD324DRAFT_677953 [Kockovaella imperatae]ORX40489.1 hypothetical protein BD324DRAFT_677953 [Kockovaella imperatae]